MDAGRVAGDTGPRIPRSVTHTLMMVEVDASTCGDVADTAVRMMVMSR